MTAILEAYETVWRMVNANGCAWHEAQTHESLTRYLIEESYELVDAIINRADTEAVVSELADVLYQVLFHTAIAARDGEGYDFDTVAGALTEKLVKRHPHVFGDRGYMSVSELEAEWEHLKEAAAGEKRGSRHPFEGIPEQLPTLAKSAKVVTRLQKQVDKSREIVAEISQQEVGAQLLDIVKNAVANGIDPDLALREATNALIEEMKY